MAFNSIPCMQQWFLQEFLHLNHDGQCYTGEMFELVVCFYHFSCQGVGKGLLQSTQQEVVEKQKEQGLQSIADISELRMHVVLIYFFSQHYILEYNELYESLPISEYLKLVNIRRFKIC